MRRIFATGRCRTATSGTDFPARRRRAGRNWLAVLACMALVIGFRPAMADELELGQADLALLAAPDLSSPRATLTTFRTSVQRAHDLLGAAYADYRDDATFAVSEAVSRKVTQAGLLLRRAVATLDLSQVPAVNRAKTGMETALLIQGILDRLPPTPDDDIPDAAAVKAAEAARTPIADWTLPYSDIRIVRMAEGPKAGQYLFSAGTVARAQEFYDAVRTYADRPGTSADFFEFYTLTPGDLLPPKWYLWIEELPDWTRASFAGQAIWQWAGFAVTLIVLFGGWWAVSRVRRRSTSAPVSALRRFGGRLVMPLLLILVCALALRIISGELNITGWPFLVTTVTLHAIAYLAAAWVAYLLALGIAEWIISSPRIDPTSIDASLLRISSRVVGIAAAIGVIFYGATDIGISVYGVVAGLGVGGLALGLAARPTLENLIGGLILYADRPVRVGDFCQFGSMMGTVEEIGLRSTRIRALDRTLITVPNAEFSNMQLINHTRRDRTMLRTTIGLRYETTREQMNAVLDGIRALLLANPDVAHDTVRVRFRHLGDYALGVEVFAYVNRASNSDFLEVQEGLLLQIMKIIEDCGTAIAFPSQTTYHVHETAPATGERRTPAAAG